MNLSLSHTRASGFAQGVPPRGSFVSSGQADSDPVPPRNGYRSDLNMRFYTGPAWRLVPVRRLPTRPSECLRGSTRPERVDRVLHRCLLKRRCGLVGRLTPTAPGIGAGALRRTPAPRANGRARARLRRSEVQARPSSLDRGLSPGQSTTVSVRVASLDERCDSVCSARAVRFRV